MTNGGVVADERGSADTALLDPVGWDGAGCRRLLVAFVADDGLQLGDELDVDAVVGETLDEGRDTLGRCVEDSVDALRVVVPVAERAVWFGVGPVRPRPGVGAAPESVDLGRRFGLPRPALRLASPADEEGARCGEHERADLVEIAVAEESSG